MSEYSTPGAPPLRKTITIEIVENGYLLEVGFGERRTVFTAIGDVVEYLLQYDKEQQKKREAV